MATPSLPVTPVPAKKQKLFQFTQTAMDNFTVLFKEHVPLSSENPGSLQFYSGDEIVTAGNVAKCQVIMNFKRMLQTQTTEDENSIATRAESLEAMFQMVINAHLEENTKIYATAEKMMTELISNLIRTFTKDVDKIPVHETYLPDRLETLRECTMASWSQMKKPGNSEFQKLFQENLENQMNEIYSKSLQKHQDWLKKDNEEAETYISNLVNSFGPDLEAQMEDLPEIEELKETFEELTDAAMWKWRDYASNRLQVLYCADVKNQLAELCSEHLRKYQERLTSLKEEGEEEIVNVVQQYKDDLLKNKFNFDASMHDGWTAYCVTHQSITLATFMRHNPFPAIHSLHEVLNEACSAQLEKVRLEIDGQRWRDIYMEAVRGCLVNFLMCMERRLYGLSKVSTEDLEELHSLEQDKALFQWEQLQIEIDGVEELTRDLENKIARALPLFQTQVEEQNKVTFPLVQECQNLYKSRMASELEVLHNKHADHAKQIFREKSPAKDDSDESTSKDQKYLNDFLENMAETGAQLFAIENDFPQELVLPVPEANDNSDSPNKLPQPLEQEETPEIKRFEKLYCDELREALANLEQVHQKTESMFLSAFKMFCILEDKSVDEVQTLVNKFTVTLANWQKAVEILEQWKLDLDEKRDTILNLNPEGVPRVDFTVLQTEINTEILSRLEAEIEEKVGIEEPLSTCKQAMERYIDVAWVSAVDTNDANLWKYKRFEEALNPLYFHLQSRQVTMGAHVEGYTKILPNEFGEMKTPAVVVRSPNGSFVYGAPALFMMESTPPTEPEFIWTLANFFSNSDSPCIKTALLNGKEHPITPTFLLSYLLKKLKTTVERQVKYHFPTVCIAVPFWLSCTQRASVEDASKVAGFSNVHLVNESSAIAYWHVCRSGFIKQKTETQFMVTVENMDRVDAFVYGLSYSEDEESKHGVLRMVSNFGNYRMEDRKFFSSLQAKENHDIEGTRQVAKDLVKKNAHDEWERWDMGSSEWPKDDLCIMDNSEKWGEILEPVITQSLEDFQEECVLDGMDKMSWELIPENERGCAIKDQLVWDIYLRKSPCGLFNRREILLEKECNFPSSDSYINSDNLLKPGEEVTYYQLGLAKTEHMLGTLRIDQGASAYETWKNFKPIFELSENGTVKLYRVEVLFNTSPDDKYLSEEYFQWNSTWLSAKEIEYLSELLVKLGC